MLQTDFYFSFLLDKHFVFVPLYTIFFFLQVKHRRSDLLKHALVSTFLRKKFKFGAVFHLADLFLYLLFLMFLTSYALVVPKPLDDICKLRYSKIKFIEKLFCTNVKSTFDFAQVQQMLLTILPMSQGPCVEVVTY